MGRLTKFAVGILLLMLTLTAIAGRPSQPVDESRLREYRVQWDRDLSSEADICPTAAEIATSRPTPVLGTGVYLNCIFDYHHMGAPIITVGTRAGTIHWALPRLPVEGFIRYSPDARLLLDYDGAGLVHLFELASNQPQELRTIDLGLTEDRPNFQPVDMEWSPDSGRIAVILSFKIFHGGFVRVYDVSIAKLQWERSIDFVEMGGEAWSPDGRRLAITLLSGAPNTAYPERSLTNLLVLDADSGEKIQAIATGDRAGPVCFAPGNAVLTAPLYSEPHSRGLRRPEAVSEWDATTGKLIRRIASPGRDIHDDLALSRDGAVLLGYVGKEKSGFVLRDVEVENRVLDRRFQLFDYKSGKVIATSPDLERGGCAYHMPAFRLSPRGDRVLVYWPNSGCAPSVFEVPPDLLNPAMADK